MSGALNVMLGVSGAPGVVNLPDNIVSAPPAGAGTIKIERDGDILEDGVDAHDWVSPKLATIGDFYQVIFRNVTGDIGLLSGPALDTWHDLSSDRTWTMAAPGVGIASVSGTIAIREKATGLERDSCSAQMSTGVP